MSGLSFRFHVVRVLDLWYATKEVLSQFHTDRCCHQRMRGQGALATRDFPGASHAGGEMYPRRLGPWCRPVFFVFVFRFARRWDESLLGAWR